MMITNLYKAAYGKTIGTIEPKYANPDQIISTYRSFKIINIALLPVLFAVIVYLLRDMISLLHILVIAGMTIFIIIQGYLMAVSIITGIEDGKAYLAKHPTSKAERGPRTSS